MRILIVSTSDAKGGAAKAAYRLHKGLENNGANSSMLVRHTEINEDKIYAPESNLQKSLDLFRIPINNMLHDKLYPKRSKVSFSTQWVPDFIHSSLDELQPDIINLHWINDAFIRIETLGKVKKPIVWTIHDMWPFTGGCHYSQGCDKYQSACGNCPILKSERKKDLSHWVLKRKFKAWNHLNLTIVVLSTWMEACVSKSSLFKNRRIEMIPNGIDTSIFKKIDRQLARSVLNLPKDKRIILVGALQVTADKRKGLSLLQDALQELYKSEWKESLEVVVFGSSKQDNSPEFGVSSRYMGVLKDEYTLSLLYSSADVFVAPSLEDNLPNTVLEAMACGTPCVAFNIGGMPDLIEHNVNGYLARPFHASDLARGIALIINDTNLKSSFSLNSLERVRSRFDSCEQSKKYLDLFHELVN